MKWIFTAIFSLLFFFLLLKKTPDLADSYIGKDISTILTAIPKKDRKDLEYFFRELIGWGGFGYVLLGEKPMAFDVIEENVHPFKTISTFRFFITPRRIKLVKGFKKWKKYEKFFPTSSFCLFYEKARENNPLITLINKDRFSQQITINQEDFEKVLNRKIEEAGELLNEGFSKPLISEVFLNHDLLIGILLGYGRNNAYLFHQKCQLSSEEEELSFCNSLNFKSAWTDEEFQAFCKQFESISWVNRYITGSHMRDLKLIALPGFQAILDSEETRYWRQHYLKTKEAIIDFYEGKDFLETTLRLLTS